MSGELVNWLASTPAERDRDRAVDRVYKQADVVQAKVSAIVQVSQAAMLGTLSVSMMKREAALLVPEDAAKFDLIATQAAIPSAMQIEKVGR